LKTWIRKQRRGDPFWEPSDRQIQDRPKRAYKVGDIRKVCDLLDEGVSIRQIERDTGYTRQTIKRWRDEPVYREATYEYNYRFTYSENDLLDRAVVAHSLCTQTESPVDRLDLLCAVVGITLLPPPPTPREQGVDPDRYRRTHNRRGAK
jgi:hypothetical protein